MADRFAVSDAALRAAGATLVTASEAMVSRNVVAPAGVFESLTGIDSTVQPYFVAVGVARAALADAAKLSSLAIAGVMHSSDELDAHITRSLNSGFAVQGGGS